MGSCADLDSGMRASYRKKNALGLRLVRFNEADPRLERVNLRGSFGTYVLGALGAKSS